MKVSIEILERALKRERAARKQAEGILEQKSEELFSLTQELQTSNTKLEKLVKEKTSELKSVFKNIIDAYVVMDLTGDVIEMNDAAVLFLGYSNKKEKINLANLVYPEDQHTINTEFKSLWEHGAVNNYQVRIVTKSGAIKLVDINASLIYNAQDTPIAAQGIVRDITKEKEAEEQLIASENRLATIILNLDSGVLLEDEHRKVVLTNSKFCELFSIPVAPEALVGADCQVALEKSKGLFKDPEGFVDRISALLDKKEIALADELITIKGAILERDYIPIFKSKVYKGHLWTYKDVTLERKYRQSIEAQRQKYRNIIANMNLGLLEVNRDDEILLANSSFEIMSGYTEAELIGKKGIDLLLHKDSKAKLASENEGRLLGASNSYEVVAIKKDGSRRHWLISGAPNYDINGEVVGSIGVHLDITELKNLESQKEVLLKKLETSNEELQEYAQVVSHDLKSPLRSIYALADWIKEDNEGKFSEETEHNFSLIHLTLEKMEQLISDVLDYSSVNADNKYKVEVDLNEVIEDIFQIVYVPDHIKIELKTSFPFIMGNRSRLQQLFQNLISNALRYTDKEEGKIEISCKDLGNRYKFSVRDNGIGIAPEHHEKIFKMFQSLHQNKESTGVGLSIVKKIVESYHGEIWLDSSPGVGTTFYFILRKGL
jgi:PAS domain S-box-containing protein